MPFCLGQAARTGRSLISLPMVSVNLPPGFQTLPHRSGHKLISFYHPTVKKADDTIHKATRSSIGKALGF